MIKIKFSKTILETPLIKVHSDELMTELVTMKYKQYLTTEYWFDVRKEMHSVVGYACEICGTNKGIQVHHLHYGNRGKETLNDLVCLCGSCHNLMHYSNNPMVGYINSRKIFYSKVKLANKIKKKFSNKLYLKILPLEKLHGWTIEQIENLFEFSKQDFIKKFSAELENGLIIKNTGVCGDEDFEFYSLDTFVWNLINLEYPKI